VTKLINFRISVIAFALYTDDQFYNWSLDDLCSVHKPNLNANYLIVA